MKRLLRLTGGCLALAALWTSAPAAATDVFAQHFPLELGDGAAFYSVTLSASVYEASRRGDLGDLRVLNGAGEAVPYSLDAPREPARTPPVLRQVRWFPLPPAAPGGDGPPPGVAISPDGSLRATSAPPPRAQHDVDLIDAGRAAQAGRVGALLVHLRDDNYQGRVRVEASDDLRRWQPAGDAQLLKVNYNGSTLSQNRIELDAVHMRYLRLHWLDGSPYVDSIDAEVLAAGVDAARRADTQREWRKGLVAQAGVKPGEYFFSTGRPYPVDRLVIGLPQPNTVAQAVVYSRTGLDAPWRELTHATLFRLHNGEVEQSNAALELKPDTDRQWRVVVDTRNGGVGVGALTVAAGWHPATLTFAAHGSAPFTLAVGSTAATSAAVSRDELLKDASSVAATARLGDALHVAQQTGATPVAGDPALSRRSLLWAALALAVGSLGVIAWWRTRAGGVAGGPPGGAGAAGTTADTAGTAGADADGPGNEKGPRNEKG
ncbi:DUF3999 domain-containing protein [Paraburkholderia sediminicola]|uniref:DUF3999 domain-containing protein n=1 Tax=Paraburkholderia rhynchosiae TaxID=487049 RepID=A0ACC7N8D7_9BURK